MPIFIAKHYDGTPIDVILTANLELANAYWHGKGVIPHSVDIKSDALLAGHQTGVLPIVSTSEEQVTPFGQNPRTMHVVRRNHS